jgi:hypothetical protein
MDPCRLQYGFFEPRPEDSSSISYGTESKAMTPVSKIGLSCEFDESGVADFDSENEPEESDEKITKKTNARITIGGKMATSSPLRSTVSSDSDI